MTPSADIAPFVGPGRRVAVVGLAKSGLAAARLCRALGAEVEAHDTRPLEALGPEASALRDAGVRFLAGQPLPERFWSGRDCVVVSPGVPLSLAPLRAAADAGVPVFGEVELAWRQLGASRPPVFGITGTNGKSSTTALTGELFRQGGRKVFVGGNLGTPYSEVASSGEAFDVHVVELSSFQLEGVQQARFHGAALLNLAPDHLDRYADAQAYAEAKARIFLAQKPDDFAVVNLDDAPVAALGARTVGKVFGFTTRNAAARVGLAGVACATQDGFRFDFGAGERFVLRNPALRGEHNVQNAMAAALLASAGKVSASAIQAGLDAYPGLPHRLERVRVLDGVEWVNDSKATNVDSAKVALAAFAGGVWLIAGGKGKGASYAPLVEAAKGKLKGVLTLGEDAPAVEAAFAGTAPVHPCGNLAAAVRSARAWAKRGEVVLLAPACASYDQFQNFEDRGDTFKRLVGELE